MVIIAKVSLPCDPATLENAIRLAAHEGHWHDAKIKVGDLGNELIVYHQDSTSDQK